MKTKLLLATLLMTVLAAPVALADNDTDIDVDVRDTDDNDGAQESTEGVFLGMNGTTLVIILVVGVILIALVAALAGRDRYW